MRSSSYFNKDPSKCCPKDKGKKNIYWHEPPKYNSERISLIYRVKTKENAEGGEKQTYNMRMLLNVMLSARLLQTSAGLKTKNTIC